MLKDKYTFTFDWASLTKIRWDVDAVISNQDVIRFNKNMDLVPLSLLRVIGVKLQKALIDTKEKYRLTFTQSELLAYRHAYVRGWIKQSIPTMELVETIDKQI